MIAQKATILCIYDILKKYTDETHILSAEKIREKLKIIYGIDMERKAIYRNIDALRGMGIEIEGYQENREGYCLIDREFELSEIRLLCDAVAASAMIKEGTGKTIIKKLIDTQSIFQGRMLQKTVFVKSEEKILNKQLFYNIDTLNAAISQGCKVSAWMMEYGLDHKLTQKEDNPVIFSPYATLWAEGNYFILGKREEMEELEHYRIDMLKDIVILERGVDMIFGGFNPSQYARERIIRKGEKKERYELECKLELWQEIADRFGSDADVIKKDFDGITVKIVTVPYIMRDFVRCHLENCTVLAPKKFREEIQRTVMEAYNRICAGQRSIIR